MYILLIINYTEDAWLEELSIYPLVIFYSSKLNLNLTL